MVLKPFALDFFDLQLFAGDDDLASQTPEQLIEIVKSERRAAAALRGRITTLEGEKTALTTERDTIKTERDTLATEKESAEDEKLKNQKKFEELATKEREKREKAERDAQTAIEAEKARTAEEIAKRDRSIIRSEARTALTKAGVHDEDDVDIFGIDSLKLEDGKVVGIDDWIKKSKEAKPHKFKAEGEQQQNGSRPGTTPPAPGGLPAGDKGKIDFRTLSDEEYVKQEQALLATIGAI